MQDESNDGDSIANIIQKFERINHRPSEVPERPVTAPPVLWSLTKSPTTISQRLLVLMYIAFATFVLREACLKPVSSKRYIRLNSKVV